MRGVLVAAALLAAVPLAPRAAGRRPIADTDLLDFVWLADPRLSPDRQSVAFVRVVADRANDRYDSSIWVVPTDGRGPMRRMTAGPRDTAPRWAPDGRRLTFLRVTEEDGTPDPPQIYGLDLNGGNPVELIHMPEGVADYTWSSDGRHLALVTLTGSPDVPADPGRPAPSDVRVITRASFRSNGVGYRDARRRTQVMLVTLPEDGGRAMSRPFAGLGLAEHDPVFSPDGATLFFTTHDVEELDFTPPRTIVRAVPVAGGPPRVVATVDGEASRLSPSPDGRTLAAIGTANATPVRSYQQPDLFAVDVASGAVTNLTADYDFDVGGALTGDQRAPRGAGDSDPAWTPDGAALRVISAAEGRTNVVRVDVASHQVQPVTSGSHEVQEFAASAADDTIVALVSTPTNIGDLYRVPASGGLVRLTSVNDALFSTLDLPEPQEIRFESFDGRPIQGWLVTPPGFDRTRTYPLILQIHGGPHAAYGATFTHEFLAQAARGYVVLYVNPRGSTTYGQEFGNVIQYHYPGDDFRDLMRAVDVVLERGFVDPRRMGVTGGSGGGLLTNWTIGHTTRFRAAVSQRSIADWEAWWYAADFTLFRPRWFRGAPWEHRDDFAARSPITYADAIETPLMLLDGDADLRTPPAAGGEAMFRALKLRHVPVVMVRVPDETHELSRSGRPWHRVDRLRHIANWFDKWILGAPHPEYDDTTPGQGVRSR